MTANFDGTTKHETVIGDGAFIGVDTMLRSPVTIGPGAKTGAGSVVTRDVAPGRPWSASRPDPSSCADWREVIPPMPEGATAPATRG